MQSYLRLATRLATSHRGGGGGGGGGGELLQVLAIRKIQTRMEIGLGKGILYFVYIGILYSLHPAYL